MKLDQLQTMSNSELNELAAIKILRNGIVNVPSDDWNPTGDMNDAIKLLNEFLDWHIRIERGLDTWRCVISEGWVMGMVYVEGEDKSPAKAITIAAILAKG